MKKWLCEMVEVGDWFVSIQEERWKVFVPMLAVYICMGASIILLLIIIRAYILHTGWWGW